MQDMTVSMVLCNACRPSYVMVVFRYDCYGCVMLSSVSFPNTIIRYDVLCYLMQLFGYSSFYIDNKNLTYLQWRLQTFYLGMRKGIRGDYLVGWRG